MASRASRKSWFPWIASGICAAFSGFFVASGQTPSTAAVPQSGPYPPVGEYHYFILQVGMEDERLRNSSGNETRINYAAGMGIDPNEEQKVLSITLVAYKQERDVDRRWNCYVQDREVELHLKYGPEKTSQILSAIDTACRDEKFPVWVEMRNKLMAELGYPTFKKVDRYINMKAWVPPLPHPITQACPVYDNPDTGAIIHVGQEEQYYTYFRGLAMDTARNEEALAAGKEPFVSIYWPPDFTGEVRSKVTQLAKEAYATAEEDNRQFQSAANAYKEEHHLTRLPNQSTPEIDHLWSKIYGDTEPYIAQLRAIIGEEDFQRMDRAFAATCKAGNVVNREEFDQATKRLMPYPSHPLSDPITNLNPVVPQ